MILIPIGHEETSVRRLPWITFGVIASCFVAFLLSGVGGPAPPSDEKVERAFEPAVDYYLSHPYLEVDPEFMALAMPELSEGRGNILLEAMKAAGEPPEDPAEREAEQRELDRLVARAMDSLHDHPLVRWGLTPNDVGPLTLLTHMFMHAGWLHLLGNLLILYLAAPYIEDVWGRPLFLVFYLTSGVAAAFTFIAFHGDSSVPMIGASGAIAGVMGAFLVRYAKTRIRFFYLVSFYLRGTFSAPAWLMLPLWLAQQLLLAAATTGSEDSGGVAYWAHIGGFVFGAVVAGGMARFDVEGRWLEGAIDRKTTTELVRNTIVDRALEARAAGHLERAFGMLADHVPNHPTDRDAALALWSVAVELGRARDAAPAMLRAIHHELRSGETGLAVAHWDDLSEHAPETRADPALLVRLAQGLEAEDRRDDALVILRTATLASGTKANAVLALQIARVAETLDPDIARAALRQALASPDLDPQTRADGERRLARLTPLAIGAGDGKGGGPNYGA